MSRKPRTIHANTHTTTAASEQPTYPPAPAAEEKLTGRIAQGAASGTARSVTDWIIQLITDHIS